ADKLDTAVEQLHSAEALLRKARHDLETAENLKVAAGTAARVAEAALATADLNLTYTRIIAPADGFITNLNLPPGNYVRAGEQLFALVDSHSFWLSAIYRETHLTRIKPGQPATIRLYLYPDRIFHGVVQGIGWGIHQEDGATVSLLPDVSPVIYWVRLAQRFPVRLEFTDLEPSTPLRLGARGTATIYTEQVKDDGSK